MHGNLPRLRYDEIEASVVDMFEECDVHTWPLDPYYIASKLHYLLVPYSTLPDDEFLKAYNISEDAYSIVEEDPDSGMFRYVIYFNDGVPSPGRKRFSLFHEIGHCYLGHHDNRDDSLADIEEEEANHFAKYAMAAPPLIHLAGCKCPEDVVDSFRTSNEAGTYSFEFYQRWCCLPLSTIKEYERRLVKMFFPAA